MLFPYEYYKYRPNQLAFNNTDMLRFRNTFVYSLYDNGNHNMGVNGTNGTTPNEDRYSAEQNLSIRNTSAIFFAYWSDFDSLSNTDSQKVYNIVINDYIKLFYKKNVLVDYYRGQKCFGHAKLVCEQWKYQKENLTIFNRDMVYNQNFSADGSISIDPKYNRPKLNPDKAPFAMPKTFTDNGNLNRFVIEPDVEVNLTAGKSISIKEGFYVKKGARFKAVLVKTPQ
jgi:hypothetical protein